MIKNCVNCGAPIEKDKKECPYCKTSYDISGFQAKINDCEMFGEITIGGKTCRVYIADMEIENVCDCESARFIDGTIVRSKPALKRTFKLVEV